MIGSCDAEVPIYSAPNLESRFFEILVLFCVFAYFS